MKSALTLVLGAIVVWLLIDRNHLQQQLADKREAEAEEAAEAARYGSGGRPNSSWLNAHIEKGAKSLEKKRR